MSCEVLQWLIAGAGPSTLTHGLIGIGCVLAYDTCQRWWNRSRPQLTADETRPRQEQPTLRRRAA